MSNTNTLGERTVKKDIVQSSKYILIILGMLWTVIFLGDLVAGRHIDFTPSSLAMHPFRSPDPIKIVRLTNEIRMEHGLLPLKIDSDLSQAARIRSKDMAEGRYIGHKNPYDGSGPPDAVQQSGYSYLLLLENLSKGPRMTAKEMVDGWMKSRGHRENLLDPEIEHIGVSIAKDGWLSARGLTPTNYGAQLFGKERAPAKKAEGER